MVETSTHGSFNMEELHNSTNLQQCSDSSLSEECLCMRTIKSETSLAKQFPFMQMLELMRRNGALDLAKRIKGDCDVAPNGVSESHVSERDVWSDCVKCDTREYDARVRQTYLDVKAMYNAKDMEDEKKL